MSNLLTEKQMARFRQLAALDDSRELLKELLALEEEKKKNKISKKKKKKDCVKGNARHTADGQFAEKGKGTSWSKHTDGKSDCKAGQFKLKGNKHLWTKTRCGREDREDPNVKAKFKCKDGSLAENENMIDPMCQHTEKALDKFSSEFSSQREFLTFLSNMASFIDTYTMEVIPQVQKQKQDEDEVELNEKRKRKLGRGMKGEGLTRERAEKECARFGLFSFEHFLQTLNRYESAKKATLNQRQK